MKIFYRWNKVKQDLDILRTLVKYVIYPPLFLLKSYMPGYLIYINVTLVETPRLATTRSGQFGL